MTTYVYHIRLDSKEDDEILPVVDAIETYLKDGLQVHECLELTTKRPEIATAIENLFNVRPELHCDESDEQLDALMELRLNAAQVAYEQQFGLIEPDQEAEDCFELPGRIDSLAPLAPVQEIPTFEAVQEWTANARKCEECGLPFDPPRKDSRFFGKRCAQKAYGRAYATKKTNGNGNGHGPSTGAREIQTPAENAETQPQDDGEPHQVRRWMIGSTGTEVETVERLLTKRKLAVGERVHHLNRGWYVVYQTERGTLNLRKVQA